jgi:hypothetical protein
VGSSSVEHVDTLKKLPRNPISGWIVASITSDPVADQWRGWAPQVEWCAQTMKKQDWHYVGEGVFEFRRASDHMMFLLRWT